MAERAEIELLAEEFKASRRVLIALGDENRQHLILEMMQMGKCRGVRVGEITEKTHLSRPAVSHHLQILKDAGIIRVRSEGTKNYYFFGGEPEALEELLDLLLRVKKIMSQLPNGNGGNDQADNYKEDIS